MTAYSWTVSHNERRRGLAAESGHQPSPDNNVSRQLLASEVGGNQ